jgi:hypothetical protein
VLGIGVSIQKIPILKYQAALAMAKTGSYVPAA